MTRDDLQQLGELIDSKLDSKLGNLKNELRKEITGSANELRKEISSSADELRKEILASEKRIINGIVTFVSDHLLPVIDEKADKDDVNKIKKRVDDIESLPSIAHELKSKRNN